MNDSDNYIYSTYSYIVIECGVTPRPVHSTESDIVIEYGVIPRPIYIAQTLETVI